MFEQDFNSTTVSKIKSVRVKTFSPGRLRNKMEPQRSPMKLKRFVKAGHQN